MYEIRSKYTHQFPRRLLDYHQQHSPNYRDCCASRVDRLSASQCIEALRTCTTSLINGVFVARSIVYVTPSVYGVVMALFEDLRFEDMSGDGPTVGGSGSTAGDANNAANNDGRSAGGGAGSDGDDASEGLGSVLEADMAFALVTGFLRTQPLVGALARILAYQASLSALEAELLAANQANTGASDRETERLAGQDGKRSKREAKKKARRSKAVGANPELGSDLA